MTICHMREGFLLSPKGIDFVAWFIVKFMDKSFVKCILSCKLASIAPQVVKYNGRHKLLNIMVFTTFTQLHDFGPFAP